ncbi:putative protein FEZ-like [Capsicum annuum]|nr:putative protein FEZ-like [Capsicum annuum]
MGVRQPVYNPYISYLLSGISLRKGFLSSIGGDLGDSGVTTRDENLGDGGSDFFATSGDFGDVYIAARGEDLDGGGVSTIGLTVDLEDRQVLGGPPDPWWTVKFRCSVSAAKMIFEYLHLHFYGQYYFVFQYVHDMVIPLYLSMISTIMSSESDDRLRGVTAKGEDLGGDSGSARSDDLDVLIVFLLLKKNSLEGKIAGDETYIGSDEEVSFEIDSNKDNYGDAEDGNNQMLPLAWAVVEVENKFTWRWFGRLVKNNLKLGDGSEVTTITDMQKAAAAATDNGRGRESPAATDATIGVDRGKEIATCAVNSAIGRGREDNATFVGRAGRGRGTDVAVVGGADRGRRVNDAVVDGAARGRVVNVAVVGCACIARGAGVVATSSDGVTGASKGRGTTYKIPRMVGMGVLHTKSGFKILNSGMPMNSSIVTEYLRHHINQHQLAIFVVTPAMPDVTMTALCPGQDECSLAIYLSGFQQAIIGIGLVVMMPIIGNLSDVYGRKALLTIPVTLSIIPPVILTFRRTKKFYYVYYVLKTLTGMISDGGIQCVALAYVADHMSQAKRASAIGILAGVGSAAFVCGTLADHFLSTSQIFLVATIASMIAAVYMQIFLENTACLKDSIEQQPILINEMEDTELDCETATNIKVFKKVPSLKDILCFLKKSATFSLAASVAFLNSFAEGGEQAPFQYFLKARFHFKKDNFADVMLIANICSATSQLLLMPMLAPLIGEEVLLCLGLTAGFTNVPYTAALLPVFTSLVKPSGIAQGCISSISSIANILSPFVYSPLTEKAPFPYPGFSIMCIGLAWLIAIIPSAMIKVIHSSRLKKVVTLEG